MGANTIDVTDPVFDKEVVKSDIPVVVDFWASWCGPCLMMAPFLDQVAGEYTGRVKVVKVDVDANPVHAGELGVSAIPTLALYKGGQLVHTQAGALQVPQLRKLFDALIEHSA